MFNRLEIQPPPTLYNPDDFFQEKNLEKRLSAEPVFIFPKQSGRHKTSGGGSSWDDELNDPTDPEVTALERDIAELLGIYCPEAGLPQLDDIKRKFGLSPDMLEPDSTRKPYRKNPKHRQKIG